MTPFQIFFAMFAVLLLVTLAVLFEALYYKASVKDFLQKHEEGGVKLLQEDRRILEIEKGSSILQKVVSNRDGSVKLLFYMYRGNTHIYTHIFLDTASPAGLYLADTRHMIVLALIKRWGLFPEWILVAYDNEEEVK